MSYTTRHTSSSARNAALKQIDREIAAVRRPRAADEQEPERPPVGYCQRLGGGRESDEIREPPNTSRRAGRPQATRVRHARRFRERDQSGRLSELAVVAVLPALSFECLVVDDPRVVEADHPMRGVLDGGGPLVDVAGPALRARDQPVLDVAVARPPRLRLGGCPSQPVLRPLPLGEVVDQDGIDVVRPRQPAHRRARGMELVDEAAHPAQHHGIPPLVHIGVQQPVGTGQIVRQVTSGRGCAAGRARPDDQALRLPGEGAQERRREQVGTPVAGRVVDHDDVARPEVELAAERLEVLVLAGAEQYCQRYFSRGSMGERGGADRRRMGAGVESAHGLPVLAAQPARDLVPILVVQLLQCVLAAQHIGRCTDPSVVEHPPSPVEHGAALARHQLARDRVAGDAGAPGPEQPQQVTAPVLRDLTIEALHEHAPVEDRGADLRRRQRAEDRGVVALVDRFVGLDVQDPVPVGGINRELALTSDLRPARSAVRVPHARDWHHPRLPAGQIGDQIGRSVARCRVVADDDLVADEQVAADRGLEGVAEVDGPPGDRHPREGRATRAAGRTLGHAEASMARARALAELRTSGDSRAMWHHGTGDRGHEWHRERAR